MRGLRTQFLWDARKIISEITLNTEARIPFCDGYCDTQEEQILHRYWHAHSAQHTNFIFALL